MYSNKRNVNILTAVLVGQGIAHAVLCPGSRNVPIVHNLQQCAGIRCYAATDERSAGFLALGLALRLHQAVAVCVTSGSALLNLIPAVAEAKYQHVPLVVVSADRPAAWIDQLDGQTLPQPDALKEWVEKTVSLPEPHNSIEEWYCNRLVNEALIECRRHGAGPVHINVPITEPLYEFTEPKLPDERIIRFMPSRVDERTSNVLMERYERSLRPMLVIGQIQGVDGRLVEQIAHHAAVVSEPLSVAGIQNHVEEVLLLTNNKMADHRPDLVVYVGGHIVSKSVKEYLRSLVDVEQWYISTDGRFADTFTHLHGVVECDAETILSRMAQHNGSTQYGRNWHRLLSVAARHADGFVPEFGSLAAVQCLERMLHQHAAACSVCYANSSAIRLANLFAWHFVYCNRGLNGIEGTLSTAVGISLASPGEKTFCVIGDLSFFYDETALWNRQPGGNLRVLLLNNGGGGIFGKFKGLDESGARDTFVMARHHTSAEGICRSHRVAYRCVRNGEELQSGISELIFRESDRPMLLEVMTDIEQDNKVLETYYRILVNENMEQN